MIPVMEADPTVRFVHLHHCPFEVLEKTVANALFAFGTVLDVQFSCFAGSTPCNGSPVIKMSLQEEIPTKLFVLRYSCRVWYHGQVQVCNICHSPDHRAVSCPLRDLCLKCCQRGHFARDCPGVSPDVPVVADVSTAVSVPNVPVVDVPAANVPAADISAVGVSASDKPSPPVPLLEAVTSRVKNATAVADFCQPLASQEVISSILARGAVRRRAAPVVSPSRPFAVCYPDPLSPDRHLVFDFCVTRRVVIEDSATFEMYRECFHSDNNSPFPEKSVFLPGCPVSSTVTLLDPAVLPPKFPS